MDTGHRGVQDHLFCVQFPLHLLPSLPAGPGEVVAVELLLAAQQLEGHGGVQPHHGLVVREGELEGIRLYLVMWE